MFVFDDIVIFNGMKGRVLSYDKIRHKVYVLVKTGDHTWIQHKWDDMLCEKGYPPLWDMKSAFKIKYNKISYSPVLKQLDSDGDHIMSLH